VYWTILYLTAKTTFLDLADPRINIIIKDKEHLAKEAQTLREMKVLLEY
jgi:hypothetical protein